MDVLQGLTASLLVLLALAATVVFLRSRGLARLNFTQRTGLKRLQALERLPLTAQHSLHLVRLDGKLLLVASAPGGCNIVGPFENFSDLLQQVQSTKPSAGADK
jgi:flagellar biogenesis protein FliO